MLAYFGPSQKEAITYYEKFVQDGIALGRRPELVGGGLDSEFPCKITEDDGTARDKVMRIQHLGELSLAGRSEDDPKYEVIACIGGRGFGVRREDMKKMILATRGKVRATAVPPTLVPFKETDPPWSSKTRLARVRPRPVSVTRTPTL